MSWTGETTSHSFGMRHKDICSLLKLLKEMVQRSASPPTRGSRWMTAGLVQDADLDTDTVARADTKLLLSCQAPRAGSHLNDRPLSHLVRQGI